MTRMARIDTRMKCENDHFMMSVFAFSRCLFSASFTVFLQVAYRRLTNRAFTFRPSSFSRVAARDSAQLRKKQATCFSKDSRAQLAGRSPLPKRALTTRWRHSFEMTRARITRAAEAAKHLQACSTGHRPPPPRNPHSLAPPPSCLYFSLKISADLPVS